MDHELVVLAFVVGFINAGLIALVIPTFFFVIGKKIELAVVKKEMERYFETMCKSKVIPVDFIRSRLESAKTSPAQENIDFETEKKNKVLIKYGFIGCFITFLVCSAIALGIGYYYTVNFKKALIEAMLGTFLFIGIELLMITTLLLNYRPLDINFTNKYILEKTINQVNNETN